MIEKVTSKPMFKTYIYGVKKNYFVSTIWRQSSAMVEDAPWYAETIAWEWFPDTQNRGEIVAITEGDHFEICQSLWNTLGD